MKYAQLTKKAQQKAIKDYIKGFLETHEGDQLNESEVDSILRNDLDDEYDLNGNFLEEE